MPVQPRVNGLVSGPWIVGMVILSLLVGCGRKTSSTAPPRTLVVFAAASLTEPFAEMGGKFEAAHPGVTVIFNFAGSQQLRRQLEQGATADVFASAGMRDMDSAAGVMKHDSIRVFAHNRLIVICPKGNPAGLASAADLARPGLKIDLADASVPVGNYTMRMLDAMDRDPSYGGGFRQRVLKNVVSREDNVKAVVAKVRLGEADAGIVYQSDATGDSATALFVINVPPAVNQVADYPIGVVAASRQSALAGEFVDYVLSAGGRRILIENGFARDTLTP